MFWIILHKSITLMVINTIPKMIVYALLVSRIFESTEIIFITTLQYEPIVFIDWSDLFLCLNRQVKLK